ncbi:7362_t:CDS:2 [Funneliformis geosporum]|uniref:7362_t:CDS:1 n=1 Tax=Funneliformis geosporum TaxID=1117311 RepID=A0A9W4TAE8_9GLOM|nr:7362_t:CDS:2 [Funneliformis geosporum]
MALAASAVASFEWTVDAARELIRLRYDNHDDFEGFTASPSQCRRKWYSLKYGYNNLKRLDTIENPHD